MPGKIFVVGLGPGSLEQMTPAARQAIEACDVCVGYRAYVELVEPLLKGKAVVSTGMTEEIDRGRKAYALAKAGQVVALISSGDPGVYGMSGLMLEVLKEAGWDPLAPDVELEVVPGITALNSVAALLGAPLNHDFCAISLSTLLTPWEAIERRLQAAAWADFVVALYNPKSGRRDWQIVKAQEILLKARPASTPVGVVKSGYREGQKVALCTLGTMAEQEIGMLTTVIIGNSASQRFGDFIITPRGYSSKYDLATKGGDLSAPWLKEKQA
jgi:precorrin-3B C17-methyltransferase